MIEAFEYFTEEGIALKINLGVRVYLFEGNESADITAYYKCTNSGVKWVHEGREVAISLPGVYLQGYPTPDLQKVVVVYPPESGAYPAPANAVVYHANGSIHRQLQAPELISETARQRAPFMNYTAPLRLFFDHVSWEKDSRGNTVMAARLGFDRDWLETRVVQYDTGQFGECLSSGRR